MGEAAEDHLNECYANGDIPDEAAMFKEQRDRWREIAVEKDKALTEARAEIERWEEKSHAAVDAADRKIKRLETRLAAMQAALEAALPHLDISDSPGGCNGLHKGCDHCRAIAMVRAALSQKDGGKEDAPDMRDYTKKATAWDAVSAKNAEIKRLQLWIRRIENINDDPARYSTEVDQACRDALAGKPMIGLINANQQLASGGDE